MFDIIKKTDYFDLYRLNDYTFASIKNNPYAMSNAGFVNLGDTVVVFDTFLSIDAAKLLKQTIDALFHPKKYILINSHMHTDHFWGNGAFPSDSLVITTNIIYPEVVSQINKITENKAKIQGAIHHLREQLSNASNQAEVLDYTNSLIFYENYTHEDFKPLLPNLTFTDELVIRGLETFIHLKEFPEAHSKADIMMTVGNDGIVFLGDLLFLDEHPYLGAGNPFNLKKVLIEMMTKDIKIIVPGHGPLCTKERITEVIDYIDLMNQLVLDNINNKEAITLEKLPKKYQDMNSTAFFWNVDYFIKHYTKENSNS